jgi:hypothetical protein
LDTRSAAVGVVTASRSQQLTLTARLSRGRRSGPLVSYRTSAARAHAKRPGDPSKPRPRNGMTANAPVSAIGDTPSAMFGAFFLGPAGLSRQGGSLSVSKFVPVLALSPIVRSFQ